MPGMRRREFITLLGGAPSRGQLRRAGSKLAKSTASAFSLSSRRMNQRDSVAIRDVEGTNGLSHWGGPTIVPWPSGLHCAGVDPPAPRRYAGEFVGKIPM